MAISFFCQGGSGSSAIRAYQIAPNLVGSRVNPPEAENHDLAICVKLTPARVHRTRGIALLGPLVLDPLDDLPILRQAGKYGSSLRLLAASESAREYFWRRCPQNPITYLPQHHANMANERRPDRPVRVVGLVGCAEVPTLLASGCPHLAFVLIPRPIRHQHVLAFYRGLDLQVVWRTWLRETDLAAVKNPLCVLNAASFGIPTIAWPEPAFEEVRGAFLASDRLDQVVVALRWLSQDETAYADLAHRALARAADYHIDAIAARYRALEEAA